jgi:hypothetical protein
VANREVERECAGQREHRREKDNERRERQADAARQEQMHADKANPVVDQDVDLDRERQRHDEAEQIGGAEKGDLRVLPHDVATAVPRIPERQLSVLEHVLQDGAVVEKVHVPILDAKALRESEERRAEHGAQQAVERNEEEGSARQEVMRPEGHVTDG